MNKKSCFESKVTFDIELWGLDKALSFCFMKAQTEEEREKLINNYKVAKNKAEDDASPEWSYCQDESAERQQRLAPAPIGQQPRIPAKGPLLIDE